MNSSNAWSLDARALVRPAQTFLTVAAVQTAGNKRSTLWTAVHRPLFLCLVLGCVISLLSASVATVRLIVPTAIYWSFVPLIEILALVIVVWRRRGARTLAALIDAFFAGHAAWTLLLLFVAAVMVAAPPQYWWFLISRLGLAGVVIVAGWSAYVDVCFFRYVCGAPLKRAVADVALQRLIAWTLIIWIFAVPRPTPLGVFQEMAKAISEVIN